MSDSEENATSPTEKKIFEAIETNDAILLRALLTENPQNVNVLDENKMTPLQHAAYKGNKEIVQILLDQGADVKLCEHEHNYTALHFAALSGNVDVCLALLMAGAKSTETNTVGRTPCQMAAFVANYDSVAVINNFVPKEELEYYANTSGTQTTSYLPPFLIESLHKFIMLINIHPISVVMNLNNCFGLPDHLPEVKKVLELMSEKEMKRGAETNEVMSFKFHYLSYIIGEIIKLKQRQTTKKEDGTAEDDKKVDITEIFAKKLLKPGKDDNLEFMDGFLKECIREFPFRESTLFRHMVTTLSGEDPPAAVLLIGSVINGQRSLLGCVSRCNTCGEQKPMKKCSKCRAVQYCDRNCQRLHWPWHKKSCTRLSQENADGSKNVKASSNVDIKELQDYLVNN